MFIILLAVKPLTRKKENLMMSMHDRYYEPEDDDSGEFIDERVVELMNTDDYDPTDVGHMAEAIAQASTEDQESIKDFIANAEWEKLGMKLYYMSHEYMEKFAEDHATDEYNQGLLHD